MGEAIVHGITRNKKKLVTQGRSEKNSIITYKFERGHSDLLIFTTPIGDNAGYELSTTVKLNGAKIDPINEIAVAYNAGSSNVETANQYYQLSVKKNDVITIQMYWRGVFVILG